MRKRFGDLGQRAHRTVRISARDRADHDLNAFDSRAAAYSAFGSGEAKVNELAVGALVDWVSTRSRERAERDEASALLSPNAEMSDN